MITRIRYILREMWASVSRAAWATWDNWSMAERRVAATSSVRTAGGVAGALTVHDADELMLITDKGKMVRTRVHEIPHLFVPRCRFWWRSEPRMKRPLIPDATVRTRR